MPAPASESSSVSTTAGMAARDDRARSPPSRVRDWLPGGRERWSGPDGVRVGPWSGRPVRGHNERRLRSGVDRCVRRVPRHRCSPRRLRRRRAYGHGAGRSGSICVVRLSGWLPDACSGPDSPGLDGPGAGRGAALPRFHAARGRGSPARERERRIDRRGHRTHCGRPSVAHPRCSRACPAGRRNGSGARAPSVSMEVRCRGSRRRRAGVRPPRRRWWG